MLSIKVYTTLFTAGTSLSQFAMQADAASAISRNTFSLAIFKAIPQCFLASLKSDFFFVAE